MKFRKLLCLAAVLLGMVFEFETVLAAEEAGNNANLATEVVQNVTPTTEETNTVTDPETQVTNEVTQESAGADLIFKQYHIVNVLGDSITEGVGASEKSKSYPSVLGRLMGAQINNYGVSCSRITDADIAIPHPGAFVNRMYSMSKDADLIIVFGGTNDFWFGDCPIGKPTDSGQKTFYGALNKMMSYLKNAYPNADIVFITPYQQSKDATETQSYKRSTYNNFGTGTLMEYRVALLDRCQYYGIPVLDLYADYELNTVDNQEALRKYGQYLCDGCHLNDAGYALLATKIYNFVMQDFNTYLPEYVTVNKMVFETAALPALVQDGQFLMPNGQYIAAKNGVVLTPQMGTKVLYNYLIEALYY